MIDNKRFTVIAGWFLRIALASAFLSAVADRLGMWGPPGAPGVAWGAWEPFVQYVGYLNWFLPASMHNLIAWVATIVEVVIALGLLAGWRLRSFAFASGILLLMFALAMIFTDGIKGPFDYSVFTASAASFFLAIYSGQGINKTEHRILND